MIRPKSQTEDFLLSITKNCETLIEQTHTKPQETLEFKMIKPRQTFHSNPPIQTKGDWMVGLTDLEVYNSIFNTTEENNKFERFKFPEDKIVGISYIKVRDEIERDLDISDITDIDLQDDLIGPIIFEDYKKQVTKRMKDDIYMYILSGYSSSIFQDFESYLRTEVDLVEDDVRLVLDEYNSSFITFEISPGIYNFKDISEVLLNFLQSEYKGEFNKIDIEFDDVSRKTKLVIGPGIIAIKLDEKSFFSTILSFSPSWDYKHYNKYISQKIVNLSSTNKIHLKCDSFDGRIRNGLKQPILFSFVLNTPTRYKVFCEPEAIHYKKITKSVLITITFYLEDYNNEEVDFNGETLTFTIQMIKI